MYEVWIDSIRGDRMVIERSRFWVVAKFWAFMLGRHKNPKVVKQ